MMLELIKKIRELVKENNIDLLDFYIHDDEDLILFSLRYLISNFDHAFDLE